MVEIDDGMVVTTSRTQNGFLFFKLIYGSAPQSTHDPTIAMDSLSTESFPVHVDRKRQLNF